MSLFFIFSPLYAFSLSTLADYTNARLLSPHNITANFGLVLIKPSHSFKGLLKQERIVQFDYRFESKEKYIPPILMRFESQGPPQNLTQQMGFSIGSQFPQTHRKTPIYFGTALGIFHKKNNKFSVVLQIYTSIRVYQFTKSISSLVHINAAYDFDRQNLLRSPFISLTTGLNLNL